MEFKTRISKAEENEVIVCGETLSSLVKLGSFSDAIFLLLSERKPNSKESVLFEKMLISIITHSMGTVSSLSTRMIASGGNPLHVGVGGGILSMGEYHGGAIEKAMRQFYSWKEKGDGAERLIREAITSKQVLYGFGHKHYTDTDPRVEALVFEMKKIGFESQFLGLARSVEVLFDEIKGKKIPLNIDGFIALVLCDFGFDPLVGNGIFVIGRTPGLVAQCYEELKYEKPVRRVEEKDIVYIGKEVGGETQVEVEEDESGF